MTAKISSSEAQLEYQGFVLSIEKVELYEQFQIKHKKRQFQIKLFFLGTLIITGDNRFFWPKSHAETEEHGKSWVQRYFPAIFYI